jgi:hypothetical protein
MVTANVYALQGIRGAAGRWSILGLGALAYFFGKKAQNRGHLRERVARQRQVAVGPIQFVPELHRLVVDRQHAVLHGIVSRGLLEKIGENAVIIFEPRMDAVERGRRRGLQRIFDLMEVQTNGRCDFESTFGGLALRQDEQAGMPEPVEEQCCRRDNNEDACEQTWAAQKMY